MQKKLKVSTNFLTVPRTKRTTLYSVLGIAKVQRGITKEIYIQELCFLRSVHRLQLADIPMTFYKDILNGFQVTVRTAFYSILGFSRTM